MLKTRQLVSLVFGQALGDAIGYYTEFAHADQLHRLYPNPQDFEFPPSKINRRNPDHPECDWTDDTDHLILIMETLTETNPKELTINSCQIFAKKLKYWVENGVSELGDTYGHGCGNLTRQVVNIDCFLTNPSEAAKIAWSGFLASNGSVMRCAIMACRNLPYHDTVIDSILMSRCTHYDPRCDIAVGVITSLLWFLIYSPTTCDDQILKISRDICQFHGDKTYKEMHGVMVEKSYQQESEKYFDMTTLEEMDLNVSEGYALKCMAVGVWSFRNRHRPYKDVILEIILMGGDADTNAAVAGAIMGVSNPDSLPIEWLEKLPHRVWLETKLDKYWNKLNN